jgi:hypothetical protein
MGILQRRTSAEVGNSAITGGGALVIIKPIWELPIKKKCTE